MKNSYKTLKYNSKARWLSYWYQISEVVSARPGDVLIIGKGSGIVEKALEEFLPDVRLTTMDIDETLQPDIVSDIRSMPFGDNSFDVILCCQVLEHIPFDDVEGVIRDFQRITRDRVIISVPHKRKYVKIEIDLPLIGNKRAILKYPFNKKDIKSRQHHWEINRGVSYKDFKRLLKGYFVIEKTFLNEINCVHRFFVLRKTRG
ncbi:MAG: class I SAM-dependent methyltransferase [Nitrospirae bacterium]|nr:class I SAM-dependent methyltransferase [Nitrospirota bacterium]